MVIGLNVTSLSRIFIRNSLKLNFSSISAQFQLNSWFNITRDYEKQMNIIEKWCNHFELKDIWHLTVLMILQIQTDRLCTNDRQIDCVPKINTAQQTIWNHLLFRTKIICENLKCLPNYIFTTHAGLRCVWNSQTEYRQWTHIFLVL